MRIPFVSRRVSGDTVPQLSRRQARRAERAIAARDMSPEAGDNVPGWVSLFRQWGVPVAAILVLVLCAPGEQHLGDLAGWGGTMSWGLSGLFTLYAGLAAVISTQLPKGARGKTSSVWGAFLSLLLAMAAQPVSHLFVTGYLSAEPKPPLWLVGTVSSVPPLILGHLLHFAALGAAERPRSALRVPEDTGQAVPQTPVATVTRIRPRPVPSPVPAAVPPVSRPAVPAASNVLSLTKGQRTAASPGQPAGQNPSLSSRAIELWLSGWDKDKIKDTLKAEFVSPDGTPPKPNTVTKAVNRAEGKNPRP